jgi:hypothetical protein
LGPLPTPDGNSGAFLLGNDAKSLKSRVSSAVEQRFCNSLYSCTAVRRRAPFPSQFQLDSAILCAIMLHRKSAPENSLAMIRSAQRASAAQPASGRSRDGALIRCGCAGRANLRCMSASRIIYRPQSGQIRLSTQPFLLLASECRRCCANYPLSILKSARSPAHIVLWLVLVSSHSLCSGPAGYRTSTVQRKGPGSWANKSKKTRSITWPAFAQAFFKANP